MTAVKRGAIGSDFPKFKVALVYTEATCDFGFVNL